MKRFKNTDKNKYAIVPSVIRLSVIILIIVFAVYLIQTRLDYLRKEAQQKEQEKTTLKIANGINNIINEYIGITKLLSENREIINVASGITKADNPAVSEMIETSKHILRLQFIYIMDSTGTVVASNQYEENKTLTGNNYKYRDYFQQAMKGKRGISPLVGLITKKRGLYFSCPVFNTERNRIVGAVVIKKAMAEIDKALNSISYPAVLLSPEGIVFSTNHRKWLYKDGLAKNKIKIETIQKKKLFGDQLLETNEILFTESEIQFEGKQHHIVRIPVTIPPLQPWQVATIKTIDPEYPIPDGEKRIFSYIIFLYFILFIIILILIFNISKRKQASESLKENQKFLNTIIENIPIMLFVKDSKTGKYVEVNKTWQNLYGIKRKKAIGKTDFQLLPESVANTQKKQDIEVIHKSGQLIIPRDTIETRDFGKRILQTKKLPLTDGNNNNPYILGISQDITELTETEESLRQLNEELEMRVHERTEQLEASNESLERENKDRQKAEAALENQLSFMESLLSAIPHAVFYMDNQGRYKGCNAAFEKLFGINKDDILGKTISDRVKTDEAYQYYENDMKLINESGTLMYDSTIYDKDRKAHQVIFSKATFNDIKGKVAGLVCVVMDISERKKAEEALRKSEEQIRLLIETMNEGLCILTKEGYINYVNSKLCDMLGYKEEEFLNRRFTDFIICLNEKIDKNLINREEEEIVPYETELCCKDGVRVSAIIAPQPIYDENGDFTGSFGVITDITDIKQTERKLEEERNLLRTIINNIPDMIFAKDNAGNYLVVNRSYTDFVEVNSETDIIGKNIFDLFPQEMAQKIFDLENHIIITGNPVLVKESRYKTSVGQNYWTSQTIVPLHDKTNNIFGIVGIFRDITNLKKSEKELTVAKDGAERANKAKSEFLANMSHEMRTPMNAIIGFTDILDSIITDKRQRSYLLSIKSSGKNLLTLINDILDLSKIEAGRMELQFEPVNPFYIFTDIKQIFAFKIAQKQLDFIIDIAEDIPKSLILDEVRLRQILVNLIGNAVKFTNDGYIRLSARKVYKEEDKSKIELIIAVEDTGIGISIESQEKIFEAFRQQDNQSTKKYGGTGLGLSITKRLVDMMDGFITLRSEVNKGSVFEINIKNVDVSSAEPLYKDDSRFDYSRIVFNDATVMVVDDVKPNRELVKEYFRETNLRIIEAEDGQKALLLITRCNPDLVLMDLRMPNLDGYEATHIIKKSKELSKIPVIALTASAMKEDEERIRKARFDGYLQKPTQKSELYEELTKFLQYTEIDTKSSETTELEKSTRIFVPDYLEVNLSEIVQQMKDNLLPYWSDCKQNNRINDIKNFGKQIAEFGEKHSLESITWFGENLFSQANNFDIENMTITLNEFPEIIKKLNNLANNADS